MLMPIRLLASLSRVTLAALTVMPLYDVFSIISNVSNPYGLTANMGTILTNGAHNESVSGVSFEMNLKIHLVCDITILLSAHIFSIDVLSFYKFDIFSFYSFNTVKQESSLYLHRVFIAKYSYIILRALCVLKNCLKNSFIKCSMQIQLKKIISRIIKDREAMHVKNLPGRYNFYCIIHRRLLVFIYLSVIYSACTYYIVKSILVAIFFQIIITLSFPCIVRVNISNELHYFLCVRRFIFFTIIKLNYIITLN